MQFIKKGLAEDLKERLQWEDVEEWLEKELPEVAEVMKRDAAALAALPRSKKRCGVFRPSHPAVHFGGDAGADGSTRTSC